MRARLALALAGVAAALAACGPPEAGKPVSIAELCNQPDGSRVRLDGWLRYRRGLLSFCSETNGQATSCDLVLYAARLGFVRVPGIRVAKINPSG